MRDAPGQEALRLHLKMSWNCHVGAEVQTALQSAADGSHPGFARQVKRGTSALMGMGRDTPRLAPSLTVRDLRVVSGDGRKLLEVAALDMAPGEVLVVRGPSGAGKSTLLNVLGGMIQPSAGSVRWGDSDFGHLSDKKRTEFRRKTLGMVFQDHLLFDELTAAGNAALGAAYAPAKQRADIEARATALLDRFGIAQKSERAARYSGGERQRIALARALATDPPVILADEPTASLDRATADQLIDDLFAIADAQKTLIIASHDPAIHARAGRLASVIDGKLRVGRHG